MTNLEWIVKDQEHLRIGLCDLACFAKNGRWCDLVCGDCEFRDNERVLKVLNEEHEDIGSMTNLEWLEENIDDSGMGLCEFAHIVKYRRKCEIVECRDCKLKSTAEVIKALMEWHEEKNDEQV